MPDIRNLANSLALVVVWILEEDLVLLQFLTTFQNLALHEQLRVVLTSHSRGFSL